MKFNKNFPYNFNIILLVFWNVLLLINNNSVPLRTLLFMYFLFFLSGNLLSKILKIRVNTIVESLILDLGLSITFLLFSGLFINMLFPIIGISKPLALYPLIIYFDVALLLMLFYTFITDNSESFSLPIIQYNKSNFVFLSIFSTIPLLSILGAQVQNNGGSNILTQVMLVSIAVITFLVISFRKYFKNWHYTYLLLMIASALLFSFSLRSNHIIGYDIHEEYRLFQLTKNNGYWSMLFSPNNPYNACLSITILPTIVSIFTNIKDEYIFKLFNQIIFAFTPLVIFFISKNRKIDNIKSYLISFFFISQIWFMLQMPELNRQEYAYLFFSLLIYVLFNNSLTPKQKTILFILFSYSLVVSHYSTSYMSLAIVTIYYILYLISKIKYKKMVPLIGKYMLISLFVLTYLWNFQFTQTGGSLIYIANNTWEKMSQSFNLETIQSGMDRVFFKNINVNSQKNLNKAYDLANIKYRQIEKTNMLYDDSKYINYTPVLVDSEIINPQIPYNMASFINIILRINKILIVEILFLVGILYFIINRRKIKNIELNYLILSVSTFPLIFAVLFFPMLKFSYNMERVYLQILILTSGLTITGAFYLLKKFKRRDLIIAIMLILFFLQSSGLLNQYLGGTPYLNLNNYGDGYNKYYTLNSEIESVRWLKRNSNKAIIYADQLTSLDLRAYANLVDIRYEVFPSTITKSSYVYLNYTNFNNVTLSVHSDMGYITYKTPITFLSNNKNLIYNNRGSYVYK